MLIKNLLGEGVQAYIDKFLGKIEIQKITKIGKKLIENIRFNKKIVQNYSYLNNTFGIFLKKI